MVEFFFQVSLFSDGVFPRSTQWHPVLCHLGSETVYKLSHLELMEMNGPVCYPCPKYCISQWRTIYQLQRRIQGVYVAQPTVHYLIPPGGEYNNTG